MKTTTIFTAILLALSFSGQAQDILLRDSLVSDFRTLISYIEETHPDPYSVFGGRVPFRIRARETEKQIREDMNPAEFETLLSEFMASLHDGHSYIRQHADLSSGTENRFIPVDIDVIQEGLIFTMLPDSLSDYIGSTIETINGIPVETLQNKASAFRPTENNPGALKALARLIKQSSGAEKLFPAADRIVFTVRTSSGEIRSFSLSFIEREAFGKLTDRPSWEGYPEDAYLACRFIDKEKKTMLFRFSSVVDRSVFYIMRDGGMDFEEYLKWTYRQCFSETLSKTNEEMIEALPCLSEEFDGMLREMKAAGAENLIIDLRGNGGGWTPITLPTLYQLYGDRYLATDLGNRFYRLISPLYMEKMGTTLDAFNRDNNTEFRLGDIQYGAEENIFSIEQKRMDLINGTKEFVRPYLPEDGIPVYTPRNIYVLTDCHTFSAAFHYTFYLWKMGATVVGTSSSQAPNCFMEATPFILAYSGLTGSLSNSFQQFLSPDDPRAREFTPDLPVRYETWGKYGFDRHTPILYLLNEVIHP